MGLPLPLRGSSNHSNTATLRRKGGRDPSEVTEDADFGMRLARFGYRSEMIGWTTYEEAPANVGQRLRQRTRWFKGRMRPSSTQEFYCDFRDLSILLAARTTPIATPSQQPTFVMVRLGSGPVCQNIGFNS